MLRYRNFVFDNARWEGFEFRPGDIVISTPPKSGTTWMQMMCAMLIFQRPSLHRPLTEISPWLDILTNKREVILEMLEAQTHRRFIKTHTPLDGLPFDPRVTYICVGRDPRDVAVSWHYHIMNLDSEAFLRAREKAVGLDDMTNGDVEVPSAPEDLRDHLRIWIDDDTPPERSISNLRSTLHHFHTFWRERDRQNVLLFHYDDLKADLAGEMERLAQSLGIEIAEGQWRSLVDAATFDRMRRSAEQLVPETTNAIWQESQQFFRSGRSGQWAEVLSEAEVRRYAARLESLAPPDLATWAQNGSSN